MDTSNISPIEIRFLRKGLKANGDDVIRIRPCEDDFQKFHVVYQDRHSDKKWEFYENWTGVCTYLSQIFTVLPYDTDPYFGVQFSLPAYPAIMLDVDDLEEPVLMKRVWDQLETTGRGWPQSVQ
jgi:hypothetical protein